MERKSYSQASCLVEKPVQHKLTAVTCDGNEQITVSQAAHELAAVKHLQQLSAKEEALQGT